MKQIYVDTNIGSCSSCTSCRDSYSISYLSDAGFSREQNAGNLVKRCMYLKHQNCMYLCYCWRCGFIFSCQSWKTIPTGILCQTRYWTDKPKLTASTLNSEVWVSCFLFGGFTNIFNPPDEKLIYFTYVQCNVVVVVKRGGILLPICWALTASFTGHSRNPMQRASISVFGKSDRSRGWQKSWIRLVKSETNTYMPK